MDNVAYNYDLSNYGLFDDNFFQRGAELTGPSSADLGEEDHDLQLQQNDQLMQAIYDTYEESIESMIADEDSLNLHSVIYQIISNNFKKYGSQ